MKISLTKFRHGRAALSSTSVAVAVLIGILLSWGFTSHGNRDSMRKTVYTPFVEDFSTVVYAIMFRLSRSTQDFTQVALPDCRGTATEGRKGPPTFHSCDASLAWPPSPSFLPCQCPIALPCVPPRHRILNHVALPSSCSPDGEQASSAS